MTELSLAEHRQEIVKVIQKAMDAQHILVFWQPKRSEEDIRPIYRGQVCEISTKREVFNVSVIINRDFHLGPGDVFVYAHENNSIFKCEQVSIQAGVIELKFPQQLKVLTKADSQKLSATLEVDLAQLARR